MKNSVQKMAFLAGCALITLSSAAANAQTFEDEIIVTAQKRDQSLQDVGISISAFSGKQLQEANLTDSNDLGHMVPGLNIGLPTGSGNQPAIFLRGIGLNDYTALNLGPVGVYVDDLFISSPAAQVLQVFDLDRVEVLKGPQGTLYGRNTTGGAIKFIAARPTDEAEMGVLAQYGDYDTYKAEAHISGPINDAIRARGAIIRNKSDGYITNTATGENIGGTDNTAYRLLVDVDMADNISAEFGYYGANVDQEGPAYRNQGLLDASGDPCPQADVQANKCFNLFGAGNPDSFYRVNQDQDTRIDLKSNSFEAKFAADFGGATLTSITGYQNLDKFSNEDADASFVNFLNVDYNVDSDSWSQELQLAGERDKLHWIVGGYYSNENILTDNGADLGRGFRPSIEDVDSVAYPGGFDPDGAAIGVPSFFLSSVSKLDTEVLAGFGQVEYELNDNLKATGGLRYTSEEKKFSQTSIFDEPGTVLDIPLFDFNDSRKDGKVSWKAGLDYTTNSGALIYGSVSNGFKGGGYNGGFLFDASSQKTFDPETVTAYEIGLKTRLFDGRARFNAALFRNDYKDMQVFTFLKIPTAPTGVTLLENAGEATTQGVEAELTASPVDGLDLLLGASYLDTELTKYVSQALDSNRKPVDYSGNKLAQSPKVSLNGLVRYERPISNGFLGNIQLDTSYQDRVFFTTSNDPLLSQGAYWLINARIGIASEKHGWHVAGFVKNLSDEDYYTHGFDLAETTGSNQLMLGSPRQFGVEVGVNY